MSVPIVSTAKRTGVMSSGVSRKPTSMSAVATVCSKINGMNR